MGNKDDGHSKILEMFESAVKIFWDGQYREALSAFERIRESSIGFLHLSERINSYISACSIRLESGGLKPKTPGEYYIAGVIRLNEGKFDESLKYLSQAVDKDGSNDAWLFSLACAYALKGRNEEAISALSKAIEINRDNKFFARNCPDFYNIKGNKDFKELLV